MLTLTIKIKNVPRMRKLAWPLGTACAVTLSGACAAPSEPPLKSVGDDAVDLPLLGVTAEQFTHFNDGDVRFGLIRRDGDGRGPLFVRASCSSCHASAGRGPGGV